MNFTHHSFLREEDPNPFSSPGGEDPTPISSPKGRGFNPLLLSPGGEDRGEPPKASLAMGGGGFS